MSLFPEPVTYNDMHDYLKVFRCSLYGGSTVLCMPSSKFFNVHILPPPPPCIFFLNEGQLDTPKANYIAKINFGVAVPDARNYHSQGKVEGKHSQS